MIQKKQRHLDASIVVPVVKQQLLNRLKSSLSENFYGYEIIPIYGCRSFFVAWSKGITKAHRKYLILVHEDVEFLDIPDLDDIFVDKNIGMVGVLGSKIITRKWPWFYNLGRLVTGKLSGSVWQRILNSPTLRWKNSNGKCGKVVVLDGVCLVTKKKILKNVGIPKITYANLHFYDHILSINFVKKGYKLYTVPIKIVHDSVGQGILTKDFINSRRMFVKEYFREVEEFKV